jgi:hypothetical protein
MAPMPCPALRAAFTVLQTVDHPQHRCALLYGHVVGRRRSRRGPLLYLQPASLALVHVRTTTAQRVYLFRTAPLDPPVRGHSLPFTSAPVHLLLDLSRPVAIRRFFRCLDVLRAMQRRPDELSAETYIKLAATLSRRSLVGEPLPVPEEST